MEYRNLLKDRWWLQHSIESRLKLKKLDSNLRKIFDFQSNDDQSYLQELPKELLTHITHYTVRSIFY